LATSINTSPPHAGGRNAELGRGGRLERDRVCEYRPAFWPGDGAPSHAAILGWAVGFSVAMTLAPEAWGRLIEDERTQDLVVPFIGFFQSDDPEFEPADDIEERLDQAAAAIPPGQSLEWRG
jgi:uncharacterized protein